MKKKEFKKKPYVAVQCTVVEVVGTELLLTGSKGGLDFTAEDPDDWEDGGTVNGGDMIVDGGGDGLTTDPNRR